MANSRICSIDGCGKPVLARGWCGMHYRRWSRNGDIATRKRPGNGDAQDYFRRHVLTYDGDACLIWPFSRTIYGYGELRVAGRAQRVHRLVCEATHGPAPTSLHEAAHSCGNGRNGCVNPNHLRWRTHSENMKEMVEHGSSPRGERHGNAKLSADDVLQIRSLSKIMGRQEIASMFDICAAHVTDIVARKRWGWL